MSRAFVKEDAVAAEKLPDRAISPHRNLVTTNGLAKMDTALHVAREARTLAMARNDVDATAAAERDLRYWTARRATAELAEPGGDDVVRFGSWVTLRRDGARMQRFRLVGEDEADPTGGTLSYMAPLAQALMGSSPEDVVRFQGRDIEIVAVSPKEPEPGGPQ